MNRLTNLTQPITLKMVSISIVVPAYNEAQRILPTLKKIQNYLKKKKYIYELIVVDDGSTDSTVATIQKLKIKELKIIKNGKNRGKGYSVKRGIMVAKYDLVLFTDSDLATPIEELDKFTAFTKNGYDIVIASRNLPNSKIPIKQPSYRQILGKIFPLIVRLFALRDFKDTQCGFKLFKTNIAKRIVSLQTFDRYSFDVELLFIAKKMGFDIKEAPVTWVDKTGSKVRPIRDGFRMLFDIFKIRYNNLVGKYDLKNQGV